MLQLEVPKLAPTGQATFTLSTPLHSLRLLVQSISLIQMPQHWVSLASFGSHLSLIVLLWRPTCMHNKDKQTNQTSNGIPPLLRKWEHLLGWMSSWALTRSPSCATTGLQMSSWGMWGYNACSHEIVTSHCADISTWTTHNSSQPGMTPHYDPLYKVRPVLDMCQHTFLEQYIPGREVSIDEAMVKYKGRVFFRQYMPKKPIKWGIKVWMLAEPKTGYVSNFEVYLGKSTSSEHAELTLGTRVVMDISKPFHHTHRHLYFDNFFNSQQVIEELLKVGTYACGTLQANRYPPPFKNGRQSIKLKRGETRQLQKGNQLVTAWFDKRQVAVLSSNFSPNQTVTVQRRMKEAPHVKNVDMPAPIFTYNQYMGGVDLNDQLRSYYPSGRSGTKWWRYLFWFILDVSIINALILERLSPHQPSSRRRSLLHFKLDLAKQLIGGFCGRKRYPGHKRKSTPMAMALPNLPGHQEVKFAGRKRACTNCSNHGHKTSSGRTPETTFGCSRCGVNLCRSGCFLQYHTENSHIWPY